MSEKSLSLQGKGIFITEISACEGGDPLKIAERARAAGFRFVALQIAHGNYSQYLSDPQLAKSLVNSLHEHNIAAWGWHLITFTQPEEEAKLAAQFVQELDLDGYIIEPVFEASPPMEQMVKQSYVQADPGLAAERYFKALQGEMPTGIPGALKITASPPGFNLEHYIGNFQYLISPTDPKQLATRIGVRFDLHQLISLIEFSSSSDLSTQFGRAMDAIDNALSMGLAGVAFQDWDTIEQPENQEYWKTVTDLKWPGDEADASSTSETSEEEGATTSEATQEVKPVERREFYNFMLNDQPEGEDRLNYERYAQAFAAMLSSADTHPPLTVGIYGSWGMGKTFLMNKIKEHLEPDEPRSNSRNLAPDRVVDEKNKKVDIHCIRFNAWIYSGSENLWAGMITSLYSETEKYFGKRRMAFFRLGMNFRRSLLKTLSLIAVYGLLALALSLLLNFSDIIEQWRNLQTALDNFWKPIVNGGALAAIIGSALAALVPLVKTIQELLSSLVFARSEQLKALSSQPDFKDKIGFMADIKREIGLLAKLLNEGKHQRPTRLVIFIDDLDRCPPPKAVEVLEAIMLLLADQEGSPFIVVLGLDARILVKAIEQRYGEVLTKAGITGYEYLDKIVQVPFRIPAPAEPEIKSYVDSLLWRSEKERKDWEQQEEESRKKALQDQAKDKQKVSEPAGGQPESGSDSHGEAARELNPPGTEQAASAGESNQAPIAEEHAPAKQPEVKIVEVAFIQSEREALEAFSPYMSPNPRTIKRIVNIYRMVRLLLPEETRNQPQKFIKWVILTEQWPYRIAWMMQAIENDYQTQSGFSQQPTGTIQQVYASLKTQIDRAGGDTLSSLDSDPEQFELFVEAEPTITVEDVRRLRPYTFNLNPAMQSEVIKAIARQALLGESQEEPNYKEPQEPEPALAH